MKSLFILCFFLLALSAQSQNSYFVDTKGTKTIMRDDAIEIILIDKRLSYKQVGKTWEKYIRYKDLDYAVWGDYIFKVVRVGKGKKERGFFLHAESKTHKLLTVAINISSSSNRGTVYSYMLYEVMIVDSNYNVIEDMKFTSLKNNTKERENVAPLIKKYFSDCEELLDDLKEGGASERDIEDFLAVPKYINCQ